MAKNLAELLFALSSPRIERSFQKYLILNVLCGFSSSSLARILERNEKALEEQLASERKKITEGAVRLTRAEAQRNLGAVTKNIYEIFSLGQNGLRKGMPPIASLCLSAIRLGEALLDFPATKKPGVHALLSFMLLNASRLRTMNDSAGNRLE